MDSVARFRGTFRGVVASEDLVHTSIVVVAIISSTGIIVIAINSHLCASGLDITAVRVTFTVVGAICGGVYASSLGAARIVRACITIVATEGNTGTTEDVVAGISVTIVGRVNAARRVVSVDTTQGFVTRGGLTRCVIVTYDRCVRATGGRVANISCTFVVVVTRYLVIFTTIDVITTVVSAEAIIIAGNNGENTSGGAIAIGTVACIRGGTIYRSGSATGGG